MDINELRNQTEKYKEKTFQRSKDYCICVINSAIHEAVEKGKYSTRISISTLKYEMPVVMNNFYYNVTRDVINAIDKQYTELGFNVKFSSTFGMTIDWSEQN
ncbi:hypothetical protein HLE54_000085 [Staphylococcus pseudintermedius]|nr:hypothetical protein [Staphylococcus pseudintermedius]EGQ1274845.1 hypothetical protein [Staphylococcus pseudintermedius]EGQ2759798.1 hypothetical protein [Staphylococcus pseudintermedius]EGQ2764834.1 hypothetical protein [Staphylococcus pseudintermedius]EGQ3137898.1 hypothetical protein [Staphylococcus pseudintermedius]